MMKVVKFITLHECKNSKFLCYVKKLDNVILQSLYAKYN
jgi:hypothetical protein